MKLLLTLILLSIAIAIQGQTVLSGMPVPNGHVYAIEKFGNTMYLGGFFNEVNGLPRAGLARFDANTGVLDSWSPTDITNGVTSIHQAADKLIVGGSFQTVNGQPRLGICMFDMATGNLDPWTDNANFISWNQGVGVDNNVFYYCKLNPSRIVAVDATTGNATSWQSSPDFAAGGPNINTIHITDDHVYVGGGFDFDSGASVYSDLCRFDKITGALDSTWHPDPSINNFGITSIVETNNNIFVGGDFDMINGVSRKGVAAYDMNGNLDVFDQNSSSYEVLSLYPDGDYIWVGGNSYLLGGQSRYRIAQIRISNSQATCWDVSSTSNGWSTVQAIHVASDTVYAGPFGGNALNTFVGGPLPQTSMQITGPSTVAPGQMVTYSVPLEAGYTYAWTVTGGTGTSTTNSINVNWGIGPIGSVSVVVTNPNELNCSNEIAQEITISTNISVGPEISEADHTFTLFPNPASAVTVLQYPLVTDEQQPIAKVVDMVGNVVRSFTLEQERTSISIDDLNQGIYFVWISTDRGSFAKKLIIR